MERTFKGVWIAAEIWLDKDLTLVEKALLAEIDKLHGQRQELHQVKRHDSVRVRHLP